MAIRSTLTAALRVWKAVFIKGVLELMDRESKPIILVPGHSTSQVEGSAKCVQNGIPTFPTPERAVMAIKAMVEYGEYVAGNLNSK